LSPEAAATSAAREQFEEDMTCERTRRGQAARPTGVKREAEAGSEDREFVARAECAEDEEKQKQRQQQQLQQPQPTAQQQQPSQQQSVQTGAATAAAAQAQSQQQRARLIDRQERLELRVDQLEHGLRKSQKQRSGVSSS